MQPDLFHATPDERSIALIREYQPPEGYWLAFSGGKDSVVLLDLADRAGATYEAHYNDTTCEPPELIAFVRDQYPQVSIDRPPRSMWQLIRDRGFPTWRKRLCCFELKERGGHGRIVLTGIRDDESHARRKRHMVEHCMRDRTKTFVHPIKFWSHTDVWAYIRERSIPYSPLYDEGFTRLGCVICPFQPNPYQSMQRWPKFWKAARLAFDKRYAASAACKKTWPSADAMWEWWLQRGPKLRKSTQYPTIFPP